MIAVVAELDAIGSRYVEEILSQAGLTWISQTSDSLISMATAPAVIVLSGNGSLSPDARGRIEMWVGNGCGLVTTGGTWGLDDVLGASARPMELDGYIGELDDDHPVVGQLESSLHVFSGVALRSISATPLAVLLDADRAESLGEAIVVRRLGQGAVVAIGPNVAGSVYHIQHGHSIERDGEPAPDGSAPIDDRILKTDDGVVLDWTFDRIQSLPDEPVAECPGKDAAYPDGDTPWFGYPIADELRVILLNAIHWAAATSGQLLPALAAWPNELPAVGMISHDSDGNLDAGAQTTLRALEEADITSTWCHMWGPTYPTTYTSSTFPEIMKAGHEIALHYNSVAHDGGTWGRDHLTTQAEFVRREAGIDQFVSNKNHYLRWEGKVDYFHWLVDEGIAADQCKGPSKKGNVGYPHGSTQPWFPLDTEQNAMIDVLEIPLQFQDLWLTTPAYMEEQTIQQAIRHTGVAHFLYHQVHIHNRPEVREALLQTVDAGRKQGLEWWTSARINDWQRQRREISLDLRGDRLIVTSACAMSGVTILVPDDAGTSTLGNLPARTIVTDLDVGETVISLG
ncbi:MAG: hypothetical protein WKF81_07740 [Thermomicrobiales bacterium]